MLILYAQEQDTPIFYQCETAQAETWPGIVASKPTPWPFFTAPGPQGSVSDGITAVAGAVVAKPLELAKQDDRS